MTPATEEMEMYVVRVSNGQYFMTPDLKVLAQRLYDLCDEGNSCYVQDSQGNELAAFRRVQTPYGPK